MRRLLRMLGLALLTAACGRASAAEVSVRVVVDGETVTFTEEQPVIVSGRVMVPLRAVAEHFGAEAVRWDPATQTATVIHERRAIRLKVGRPWATVGRTAVPMDEPPILRDGRMFVPLRAVGDALGAKVTWQPEERTVVVRTPGGAAVAGTREQPQER